MTPEGTPHLLERFSDHNSVGSSVSPQDEVPEYDDLAGMTPTLAEFRYPHLVIQSDPIRTGERSMPSLRDFEAPSIKGEPIRLSEFEGQLCLVVNVASR
jgi:hypothetical protein